MEEQGDAVDQVIEQLIEFAGQDSLNQSGSLSRRSSGHQRVNKTFSVDMFIKAEAADAPWRCSKTAYFHPDARPSQYIQDILSDPYFNHTENWNPPDRLPVLRGGR